jgi:hypothetical protein
MLLRRDGLVVQPGDSYCGQQAPILYEQQHAATLQLIA